MKKYKMKKKVMNDMKALIKDGQDPMYVARKFAIMHTVIKDRK
jgi:hypothetical protein